MVRAFAITLDFRATGLRRVPVHLAKPGKIVPANLLRLCLESRFLAKSEQPLKGRIEPAFSIYQQIEPFGHQRQEIEAELVRDGLEAGCRIRAPGGDNRSGLCLRSNHVTRIDQV
jgi:hypothetical protein